MSAQNVAHPMTPAHLALMWFGVLAGPAAWAIELVVNYALVKPVCGRAWPPTPFNGVTAAAVLIVLGGAYSAWRILVVTPDEAPTDGGQPIDRSRFMAILGLLSCAFFLVVVIAGAVPQWMLNACL